MIQLRGMIKGRYEVWKKLAKVEKRFVHGFATSTEH